MAAPKKAAPKSSKPVPAPADFNKILDEFAGVFKSLNIAYDKHVYLLGNVELLRGELKPGAK